MADAMDNGAFFYSLTKTTTQYVTTSKQFKQYQIFYNLFKKHNSLLNTSI